MSHIPKFRYFVRNIKGKANTATVLIYMSAWLAFLSLYSATCLSGLHSFIMLRFWGQKQTHIILAPHKLSYSFKVYCSRRLFRSLMAGKAATEVETYYINDITEIQLSSGSVLNLFADDMLFYKPITSLHDCLQEDINRIQEWVNTNYLSLNPSKYKCMLVTRRKNTHTTSFYLGNTILGETFKNLGVLLSSDLNWTPHIENICSKARKLVGLLYRQFYNNASSDAMIKLYTAVIRPQLEYAAEVWDRHLQKNAELFENVQ